MPLEQNKPQRMHICNLSLSPMDKDYQLDAQFNPTELAETLAVNWSKLAVLGFSHMPQQYLNTDNHGFSFELMFHAIDDSGRRLDDLTRARLFLLSLCYPSKDTQSSAATGAPARAIFFWPHFASITCIVKKLAFKHTTFNVQGYPVVSQVKIDIEEIRDARLYAEEVRATGTVRSAGANTIAPKPKPTAARPRPHKKDPRESVLIPNLAALGIVRRGG